MPPENCRKCGRLFEYAGIGPIYCRACSNVTLQEYDKVRNFIREHGRATIYEISEATGVPTSEINRYLRECRLEIPDDSPIFIKCESCGCDIKCGRFCSECGLRLGKDLQGIMNVVGDRPKNMSGEMHYFKSQNDKPKNMSGKMHYFKSQNDKPLTKKKGSKRLKDEKTK